MSNQSQDPDFSLIIASAVHDMKNSLGMLLHSVDNLCNELPEGFEQHTSAGTVKYEAERVNAYLVQLLGLYRLQNKKLSMDIDEHFLADLLDENRAHYQEMLDNKHIQLSIDCEDNLAWFFDREIILGVINNALNNASRYTKGKIELSAKLVDSLLVLEVHDDGDGYPESMLNLDPEAINNNINFRSGNTSLGLYFASRVAKLHTQGELKGHIKISNGGKFGGGVFSVYLP